MVFGLRIKEEAQLGRWRFRFAAVFNMAVLLALLRLGDLG